MLLRQPPDARQRQDVACFLVGFVVHVDVVAHESIEIE